MIFKEGVRIESYRPDMLRALFWFQEIRSRFVSPDMEMVVTAGNNGEHRLGSLHYEDLAFDIRTHGLDHETKHLILDAARKEFDTEYGIILEYEDQPREHFHLQVGLEGLKRYW